LCFSASADSKGFNEWKKPLAEKKKRQQDTGATQKTHNFDSLLV
jgi:hypothetical protein